MSSWATTAHPITSSYLLYGVVGVVVSVFLILPFYLCYLRRRFAQRNRWTNRSKYWAHAGLRRHVEGDNPFTNLVKCVETKDVKAVKQLIDEGVYVDMYDDGDTALHRAVSLILPEIAELLIRSGANRELPNLKKQTARQVLAESIIKIENTKEENWKLGKIEEIFAKLKNRYFQKIIPELYPAESYTISLFGVEENESLLKFQENFSRIIVDNQFHREPTHYVVDTDSEGCYDVDNLVKNSTSDDLLFYIMKKIFLPCVLVDSSWLAACVQNKNNLSSDYEYRVQRVRFNGIIFDTIDEWKKSVHRKKIPYLQGVHLMYLGPNRETLFPLIRSLGAKYCYSVLEDERMKEPPPHFFPIMNSRFIIRGHGTDELYERIFATEGEPQTEFTVFKLPKFFQFLLEKRTYKY